MTTKTSELSLGNGKLIAKTGHVARQAHGAVTLQYGETMLLATVCASAEAKEGQDFFPLTVEYQEKMYAAGMIPGSFFKREGKATEKEVLTSRLTDRPIRPLFPDSFLNEVQIVVQVLSADGVNDPDIWSVNAASFALMLSGLPFLGPVGCARVAEFEGKFILNPTTEQLKTATLDLVVAGTREGVTMIESEAKEVSEEKMIEALKVAHDAIKQLCSFQEEFVKGIARAKVAVAEKPHCEETYKKVAAIAVPAFEKINQPHIKQDRDAAIKQLTAEIAAKLVTPDSGVTKGLVAKIVHDIEYDEVRKFILKQKKRVDGRALNEIRQITGEVGVLPRAHGSALFTRGQTQALGTITLGTSRDEQLIESYEGVSYRNFMLHYNFPPFSVGEVKSMRGPGRREIGHGALALRGLAAVVPSKEEFPYTVRYVSEILESNGSSSMATICAGTLAMMDAGVPIKAPVSGIAMGLIKEGEDWAVLSDIAGVEDHLGDMDFKVAGTSKGITTLQLDIKLKEGLAFSILQKALEQAKEGRAHILGKMLETMSKTRENLSPYAPRITTIKIAVDKISELIGPGGRMIRKITADSGCQIEVEDDGSVKVSSRDEKSCAKALELIRYISQDVEIGRVYKGTITRLMAFGAFCELLPGREGLIHISELSAQYVGSVEEVVKVGDQVDVRVIEIDKQGRVNLSIKQLNAETVSVRPRRESNEVSSEGSGPKRGRRF